MPGTPEARPETVLAFDYGRRRIGVAVGQQVTGSASALGTLDNGAGGVDWPRLDALIADWRPARLLVGLPKRADGSPGELADAIGEFCERLGRYGLPVTTVDERYSSLEAERALREGRRAGRRRRVTKGDVDAAAAAVIAERWLAGGGFEPRPDSE